MVIPFCITIYIISICLIWLDSLIKLKIPGLGMIIILVIITFLGYIGSTLLIKSLFDLIEKIITILKTHTTEEPTRQKQKQGEARKQGTMVTTKNQN